MRASIIATIFKKELKETLRDKRTLIVMIGLPIVLYPALLLLAFGLAGHRQERLKEQPSRVVVLGEAEPGLRGAISTGKGVKVVEPQAGLSIDRGSLADGGVASKIEPRSIGSPSAEAPPNEEAARLVSSRAADAVVEIPLGTGRALLAGDVAPVHLYFDETRDESREAGARLRKILDAHRGLLVKKALDERKLPRGIVEPLRIERRNVASPSRMGAFVVAQVLPVLLVSLLVMGAFYPAIDITAGEKERATLETLMTSPVRPIEVVAGKYLAVLTIALIATLANVVSMGATLAQSLSMMPMGAAATLEVAPERLLLLFVVLLPLGMLAAAVSLAVAVMAQSFKEAQNFLTPTLLLLIVPATIASAPGMELDPFFALVPGMNTALLTKALLLGDAKLELVVAVIGANFIYAALALLFAARNFSSEAVLFGGAAGRRFAALRLVAQGSGRRATPGESFFFFAFSFVVLWYAGQLAQRWDALGGLLVTQWGLLLAPALGFALLRRFDLRETFRLRLPTWRGLIAVLAIGASLPLVILAISWVQDLILPTPASLQEAMKKLFQEGRDQMGDVMVFFVVSVTPAVCEEAVFRGVVLDGFARRLSRAGTIVLVSILFGAFHLSIYRFLPTALAGAVMTYLALETGSIFASVLTHALYNGLLLAASLYLEPTFTPPAWSIGAGVLVLGAGLWLARGTGASRTISR